MLELPYSTSGQQIGETRQAMTRTLMTKDIEQAISDCKHIEGKYYILVHAKPFPEHMNELNLFARGQQIPWDKKKIKIQIIKGIPIKPHMMLSTLLFGVDNKKDILTIEWALPGSWPVYTVSGTNEPVPEVVGSVKELGKSYNLDHLIIY